jgi:trehalose 6-phosphate phosphatase
VTLPDELAMAVRQFTSRTPVLVGLDYDGVLAPFAPRPELAHPHPGAVAAVRTLAALAPAVHVALVSGRAIEGLRRVSGIAPAEPITVVGSHGAEVELPGPTSTGPGLSAADRTLLADVTAALEQIAAEYDGAWVETKPSAAVLHTRGLGSAEAAQASERAASGPGTWRGVHVTPGKSVVELDVSGATKGTALQRLREHLGVRAVLYVGDDLTDERAFAVLQPREGDLGIKVGEGRTRASYRVDGPADVVDVLELLAACSQPR